MVYLARVGRKKLPEGEKLEVVGISLPPPVVVRLETLKRKWGLTTPSATAREVFLLGLSLVEALERQGAPFPFLNLTEAYRQMPNDNESKNKTFPSPTPPDTNAGKKKREFQVTPAKVHPVSPGLDDPAQVSDLIAKSKARPKKKHKENQDDDQEGSEPLGKRAGAASSAGSQT